MTEASKQPGNCCVPAADQKTGTDTAGRDCIASGDTALEPTAGRGYEPGPKPKPSSGPGSGGFSMTVRKETTGLSIANAAGPDSLFLAPDHDAGEPCCGPPPSPRSGVHERPGYKICRFVEHFIETPAGPVPKVKTDTGFHDFLGTLSARSGLSRNNYKIAPGLYAAGNPDAGSPVLVTANYKLGFDKLRSCLKHTDAWILVIDTRGINVWCAGGKALFSAGEVVREVKRSGLSKVVSHRRLVLPQLAANGVSARDVKRECGFEVVWGPVRADDIVSFLENGMKATPEMRRVTFDTAERLVLIPVEIYFLWKPALWVIATAFLLSGIGPDIFSPGEALRRGTMAVAAFGTGILTGAVATPFLLPWIPGRAFSLKGALAGVVCSVLLLPAFRGELTALEAPALFLVCVAVSSYLAMNFTGSTPFTSPSGVEKEMRISMPLQAGAIAAAIGYWLMAAFK